MLENSCLTIITYPFLLGGIVGEGVMREEVELGLGKLGLENLDPH